MLSGVYVCFCFECNLCVLLLLYLNVFVRFVWDVLCGVVWFVFLCLCLCVIRLSCLCGLCAVLFDGVCSVVRMCFFVACLCVRSFMWSRVSFHKT